MKFIVKFLLLVFVFFVPTTIFAQGNDNIDISGELNSGKSGISFDSSEHKSKDVNTFIQKFKGYFFESNLSGDPNSVSSIFFNIAKIIKNIFIFIAVIFLIVGVINLFLSDGDDSSVTKWKSNILYTTLGIIFMQMSFSIWNNFLIDDLKGVNAFSSALSWKFWNNIISPLVSFLQWLASFAFLAMMFYAFFVIVTGAGNEDKLKKGKSTLFMALIGFIMIQLPYKIVSVLYGGIPECSTNNSNIFDYASTPCSINADANLQGAVNLVAEIFKYFNSFLTLICVILAIYAGFLYMTSKGDENTTKKSKRIIIYIAIGLILLIISHAIFVFFFNAGQ